MPVMGRTNTRVHYPLWLGVIVGVFALAIVCCGITWKLQQVFGPHQDQRHHLVAPITRTETA